MSKEPNPKQMDQEFDNSFAFIMEYLYWLFDSPQEAYHAWRKIRDIGTQRLAVMYGEVAKNENENESDSEDEAKKQQTVIENEEEKIKVMSRKEFFSIPFYIRCSDCEDEIWFPIEKPRKEHPH